MANDYFQFKQFMVRQDKCAMKVCTDSCLLGAWFASRMNMTKAALDIGSGTGLLMMMLAQSSNAVIHGIEIDSAAYGQSMENILTHPSREKLTVFHGDARRFIFPRIYDFIIANPPFYQHDLPGASIPCNIARHSAELDFSELLDIVDARLSASGAFGLILPFNRWEAFNRLAVNRFFCKERVFIRQSPAHSLFRVIMHYERRNNNNSNAPESHFSDNIHNPKNFMPDNGQHPQTGISTKAPDQQDSIRENICISESEITIRNETGEYSAPFKYLLKDFYLHL